jgi:PKD repeat protein
MRNFYQNSTSRSLNHPVLLIRDPGKDTFVMKTLKLLSLIFLIILGVRQSASAQCQASFTYTVQGDTVFYTNTSTGNYSALQWWLGNGLSSSQNNPVAVYNGPGIYGVCLTVYDSLNGCQSSWCDTIYIAGPASCNATFTTIDSAGFIYFLPNNYNPAWDYIWQFGDGSSSTGNWTSHLYSGPGPWVACLTVIDSNAGCSDTWCDTVIVNSTGGCQAQMMVSQLSSNGFFFQSTNNNGAVSYLWDFGNGQTATSGSLIYQYPTGGMYLACLTVTYANGCVSTVCDTVMIFSGTCQANFTYSPQINGATINFSNLSNGTTQTNYFWNFGDGTTSTFTSPMHFYANPGMYYVCLTMTDSLLGCTDTYCDTVIVSNQTPCNANFQWFDSLNTWFFIPDNANYTNYYWTFGDGTFSTATYPTHIYSGQGLYSVCLTVTDSISGCTATWCDSIYIQSNGCQAFLGYYADSLQANTYQFMDLSAGNYTGVYWSFGDGQSSTAINPNHTYANSGTYIVCLTIYGTNCQDSYCDTVVVGSGSNCVPVFWAMPDSVFGNGNVTFYINNNCPGWQYVWSFGDSTTGTGFGPFIHQYPATGWYYVCVTAYDSSGNPITWCDSVYAFRLGATGLSELNNAIPVNVYPNPSNGDFSIRVNLEAASPLTIEVLSIEGQLLHRTEQDHPSGVSEFRLDQTVLSAGVYFLRVRAAEQQTLTRFIIQR